MEILKNRKNLHPWWKLREKRIFLSFAVKSSVQDGFLMFSSTTRLYQGRAQDRASDNFTCCHTWDKSWETMTSVSAGHIILTPAQPVGSWRPQQESNLGHPHQESRALPTKPPRPPKCPGSTHIATYNT